jgi:hypothetical protein
MTVTASAIVSTCTQAYASWVAHASKPATITIRDTRLFVDKWPLTSALTSPASARSRQQDTVAAAAEPQRVRGVHDELHGLGSKTETAKVAQFASNATQREPLRARSPRSKGR